MAHEQLIQFAQSIAQAAVRLQDTSVIDNMDADEQAEVMRGLREIDEQMWGWIDA